MSRISLYAIAPRFLLLELKGPNLFQNKNASVRKVRSIKIRLLWKNLNRLYRVLTSSPVKPTGMKAAHPAQHWVPDFLHEQIPTAMFQNLVESLSRRVGNVTSSKEKKNNINVYSEIPIFWNGIFNIPVTTYIMWTPNCLVNMSLLNILFQIQFPIFC